MKAKMDKREKTAKQDETKEQAKPKMTNTKYCLCAVVTLTAYDSMYTSTSGNLSFFMITPYYCCIKYQEIDLST